jgi:hypothetical protein
MAGLCENLQPLQVKYFTVAAKGSQLAALADALTGNYGYGEASRLEKELTEINYHELISASILGN